MGSSRRWLRGWIVKTRDLVIGGHLSSLGFMVAFPLIFCRCLAAMQLSPNHDSLSTMQKAGTPASLCFSGAGKLLLGCDRVLRGLGHAELNHGLGRNLDCFAGLRIAAHARLAVRLHQTAHTRQYEYAGLLGLFDCNLRERLNESRGLLVSEFQLLCHVADELGFGHACCHSLNPP